MLLWLFALSAVLALGILFCIWFYADGDGHSGLPQGCIFAGGIWHKVRRDPEGQREGVRQRGRGRQGNRENRATGQRDYQRGSRH
jgi:hypothetical protein